MMSILMEPRYCNQIGPFPLFNKYKNLGKDIAEEFYKKSKSKCRRCKRIARVTRRKTFD